MSINLGSNPFGLYLGSTKIAEAYVGSTKVYSSAPAIPAYTLRFEFIDTDANINPTSAFPNMANGTWSNVGESVWDLTYQSANWFVQGKQSSSSTYNTVACPFANKSGNYYPDGNYPAFYDYNFKIIGANIVDVEYAADIFYHCQKLTSVALFDTSHLKMASGFFNQTRLGNLPNFNLSSITNEILSGFSSSNQKGGLASFAEGVYSTIRPKTIMPNFTYPSTWMSGTLLSRMFTQNRYIESGILAEYNKITAVSGAESTNHTDCFSYCGTYSETGAAELAQISSSWGGTMA